MGLQKFRWDSAEKADTNGAIPHYNTKWIGGPLLSLIRNMETPYGRRTVYVTGYAENCWNLPAACVYRGKTIRGFLGVENGTYFFREYSTP